MGRKDANNSRLPIEQYRKQIGKQDYKKTKSVLKETKIKAEAKRSAPGIRDTVLILVAVLILLFVVYSFFYLNLAKEIELDIDLDDN
ncbi:triple QxxK/R motif-containing protein [Polypterus senegalus]|uniref:triple QxxK/R motif-containing protein n=1 Tax=Polypterus senegalus TaxID=55291 RepID=UPI0019653F08|nr:triple QxxK/R motif-containing protein [Polypterus senegalus]XP_039593035.1 triple QxxK/R motif-containing protein [Polypterus senegalus]